MYTVEELISKDWWEGDFAKPIAEWFLCHDVCQEEPRELTWEGCCCAFMGWLPGRYGGSIENNCQFALEVVKAVVDEVGADRVGIRLSLHQFYSDMQISDPLALGLYLIQGLNKLNILYAHFVEPRIGPGTASIETEKNLLPYRKAFKNTFLAAGGYSREDGINAIESGYADLVVYGRLFLANPDLPKRFALNAPLNPYDRSTFYIQDQVRGYTDYPFLEEISVKWKSDLARAFFLPNKDWWTIWLMHPIYCRWIDNSLPFTWVHAAPPCQSNILIQIGICVQLLWWHNPLTVVMMHYYYISGCAQNPVIGWSW